MSRTTRWQKSICAQWMTFEHFQFALVVGNDDAAENEFRSLQENRHSLVLGSSWRSFFTLWQIAWFYKHFCLLESIRPDERSKRHLEFQVTGQSVADKASSAAAQGTQWLGNWAHYETGRELWSRRRPLINLGCAGPTGKQLRCRRILPLERFVGQSFLVL